jgi:hypothetical protein
MRPSALTSPIPPAAAVPLKKLDGRLKNGGM